MARGETYNEFVDKFKPKLTTDDCYTPKEIHDAVVKFVDRKVFKLNGHIAVRPFYPGGDFENFDYPENCIVLDNPPFSILSRIEDFYIERGIKFWLYAPHLTLFNYINRRGVTAVVTRNDIVFENGATINIGFITNVWPKDEIFTTEPVLNRYLSFVQKMKKPCKMKPVISYPDNVVSSALLGKVVSHGVRLSCPRNESVFIRKIDAGKAIFGGGVLMSERMAAERMAAELMAAERMAAERMAAERMAAERYELSEREKEIVKRLGEQSEHGKILR